MTWRSFTSNELALWVLMLVASIAGIGNFFSNAVVPTRTFRLFNLSLPEAAVGPKPDPAVL